MYHQLIIPYYFYRASVLNVAPSPMISFLPQKYLYIFFSLFRLWCSRYPIKQQRCGQASKRMQTFSELKGDRLCSLTKNELFNVHYLEMLKKA